MTTVGTTGDPGPATPSTRDGGPAVAAPVSAAGGRNRLWARLGRVSILALFLAMVVVFSVLKPKYFPTFDNTKAILDQAAILAVLGAGLTVVLVLGDFDLSFDANAALSGAVAVQVMVHLHAPTGVGILAGVFTGVLIGVANGTLVAFGRAPAFIGTLAMASVAAGIESWLTNDATIYGVPNSYLNIATDNLVGIPVFIWLSIVVVALVAALLKQTVYGRHVHAVGSNPAAASAAGIRTREVRWAGFVVLGALAGLAGVMITSQAGGSAPGEQAGLLLPTYTAAFLGASALGTGQFNAIATYFGVVFIGTLSTGLTMLAQPAWEANVITGLVLVGAVLVARRQ